jgi:thiamine-monophosphate kinase
MRGRSRKGGALIKERDVIGFLRDAFPDSGLGDDTAVFDSPAGSLLFASDAAVEGVHFRLDLSTAGQAVQKVVTSNVSDIYAMGGEPTGIVFTSGLPRDCGGEDLVSIVDGLKRSCDVYMMKLFGGDTVLSPSGYFFDVAIIGRLHEGFEPFRRSGAKPGDLLALFGEVGGSLAGLKLLERLSGAGSAGPLDSLLPAPADMGCFRETWVTLSADNTLADIEAMCSAGQLPEGSADTVDLIRRHLAPRTVMPPVNGSAEWAPGVRAMIDISDGLGRDLASLCAESGVGAVVSEEKIPVPAAVAAAMAGDRGALTALALSSGEEYVALAAVEPGAVPPGAAVIGAVTEESGGLLLEDAEGGIRPLPPAGWEHEF